MDPARVAHRMVLEGRAAFRRGVVRDGAVVSAPDSRAHYTFEHVPFDWITELFGFQRNHFDRICHFCVSGFAFPVLELLERRQLVRGRVLAVFCVVMGVFGFAAIFEIFEWLYAACSSPQAGTAFLGSQGDIWDAQKDMLSDGLGACTASALYCLLNPRRG